MPSPVESQLALFASLRARQIAIDRQVHQRWRDGAPATSIPITLNDWVRRLALDWPLAACGTARGGLVVMDLAAGALLACAQTAHPGAVSSEDVTRDMRQLNGEYDGNGVIAVAMRAGRVASAGREGGVRLWQLVGDELVRLTAIFILPLRYPLLPPQTRAPLRHSTSLSPRDSKQKKCGADIDIFLSERASASNYTLVRGGC